jgi:hypothetical protein
MTPYVNVVDGWYYMHQKEVEYYEKTVAEAEKR